MQPTTAPPILSPDPPTASFTRSSAAVHPSRSDRYPGFVRRIPALAVHFLTAIIMTITTQAQTANGKTEIRTELATLGGGCFWCIEAVFERVPGVRSVVSGYAGGRTPNPNYKAVCEGTTGHAEVVQIEFDPSIISYSEILDLFWIAHDPTTPNRQGADVGTQYRSIILHHNPAQKETAERSKQAAAAALGQSVVTEIVPLEKFYPAEDYHQDYFRNNPRAPYCIAVIKPKLQKLDKRKPAAP
jgi:peptide-methionine (S)-S-oxide reductase